MHNASGPTPPPTPPTDRATPPPPQSGPTPPAPGQGPPMNGTHPPPSPQSVGGAPTPYRPPMPSSPQAMHGQSKLLSF